MKYLINSTLLILFLTACFVMDLEAQSANGEMQPVDYVNPYIGNISHMLVPTYPVVHLPDSYLRVSPTREDYTDVTLQGLPLVESGRGYSAFHLSPYQGKPEGLQPVITYNYDNEELTPYSYSVVLNNQETEVNLGVSHQSAMYSLEFHGDGSPYLVLTAQNGMLKWDGQSISGYKSLGHGTNVYVYAVPSKTPEHNYVLGDGNRLTNKSRAQGNDASIVLQYPEEIGEVELRYGISFISEEQARKNLQREVGNKDIAALHSEARKVWNDALGKIKVKGGTEDDKTVFYTALYRNFRYPVSMMEDGRYYSAFNKQIHEGDGSTFYSDHHDSGWNAYLTTRPLGVLIDPAREEDILNSILRIAEHKEYFQMPRYILMSHHSVGMNSNHYIISFLDAYNKGLQVDLDKAFEAGRNAVMQRTFAAVAYDSAGQLNQFYQDNGYIPALWPAEEETIPEVRRFQKRMSVAVTLGVAQDDWALAQMAKEVGRKEAFQQFCKRSFNYSNLFNAETGFFHPKDETGRFIKSIDYLYSGGLHGRDYYDESNGWVYRFRLQYNIPDVINRMGGKEIFATNLDSVFSKPFERDRTLQLYRYHNQTGDVGQFSVGNEPAFHLPYLYNYAGQPWKTQKRIRMLMRQWFRNNLRGHPGDEDAGALSALAVFSYMGFYPVTPGMPIYNIGSPVFDQIELQLPNGDKFEIVAKNNSSQNKYIQSATLNGESLNKPWFRHSDITGGGKLVLQMGPKPNKQWGSDPDAAPPSMPLPMSACSSL